MRTYEEQISAVEKRIAAHNAKKRKAMKIGFSCMSVLLVITASVTAVTVSNRDTMKDSKSGGAEKIDVEYSIEDSAVNFDNTGGVITEFETITATKFYGNITESERSKDDIFEIYVVDSKEGRVNIFDKEYNFVDSIRIIRNFRRGKRKNFRIRGHKLYLLFLPRRPTSPYAKHSRDTSHG